MKRKSRPRKSAIRPEPRIEPLAYAIADVAELVSLSVDTIRQQIAEGWLEHVRVGQRVLVTRIQVQQWLGRLSAQRQEAEARAKLGPDASEDEIAMAIRARQIELEKGPPPAARPGRKRKSKS